jgi:hypothetical protein
MHFSDAGAYPHRVFPILSFQAQFPIVGPFFDLRVGFCSGGLQTIKLALFAFSRRILTRGLPQLGWLLSPTLTERKHSASS